MEEVICSICLDNISSNKCYQKWNCTHRFHEECIENWDNNCPICRNNDLLCPEITWSICRNPINVLNIHTMKQISKCVPDEKKNHYLQQWKDRGCIEEEHNIHCLQTYGIILICESCNTIQRFNVEHT